MKSHNTLMLGGEDQRIAQSQSKILEFESVEKGAHVVMDLTPAYRGLVRSIQRGVLLVDRDWVRIQDEIVGVLGSRSVRWAMATRAKVEVKGNVATLRQDGKSLDVCLREPLNAEWKVRPLDPDYQEETRNDGSLLWFEAMTEDCRCVVDFGKGIPARAIDELKSWGSDL